MYYVLYFLTYSVQENIISAELKVPGNWISVIHFCSLLFAAVLSSAKKFSNSADKNYT